MAFSAKAREAGAPQAGFTRVHAAGDAPVRMVKSRCRCYAYNGLVAGREPAPEASVLI